MLAPGTAFRRALDDALAEMEAGRARRRRSGASATRSCSGSSACFREAAPPRLRHRAPAPPGRGAHRHAHRADRGEPEAGENGNGNGRTARAELVEEEDEDDETATRAARRPRLDDDEELVAVASDPGASRRFRFRHPTASGKTIAAAGFVEAARTEGVLILTHRRLLVDQFKRDLTDGGYADRFRTRCWRADVAARQNPITIQTYAWFARHVDEISRTRTSS